MNVETQVKRFCADTPSTGSQISTSISKFVIRTSDKDKISFDVQIAKYIYATNSSFAFVEHKEFKKMIQLIRPGYKPPNRDQIGNKLLDKVFNEVNEDIKKILKGKIVCMAMDGWSNIHNEPIICISVYNLEDEVVCLIDTIETKTESHNAEYLLKLAVESIKKCKSYGCDVRSMVTDNAANMRKMRLELSTSDLSSNEYSHLDIITYGCSSHILNLLAHDLEDTVIKNKVKQIIKYFKFHHFPAAKYKELGGSSLVLPFDVRWNTMFDCLQSYIDNWPILYKVCVDHRAAIDSKITSMVIDMNLKINTEAFIVKLKKLSWALDVSQKDNCTIADVVEMLIDLKDFFINEFSTESDEIKIFEKRYDMAIQDVHYLANILHPKYRGQKLNEDQHDSALEYANLYFPTAMSEIISFQAQTSPFKGYLFSDNAIKNISALIWWKALIKQNTISKDLTCLVEQLFTSICSSAGIERLFSTFGYVHSKTRNRLGVEKASKLVTIFKHLNKPNKE